MTSCRCIAYLESGNHSAHLNFNPTDDVIEEEAGHTTEAAVRRSMYVFATQIPSEAWLLGRSEDADILCGLKDDHEHPVVTIKMDLQMDHLVLDDPISLRNSYAAELDSGVLYTFT